MNPSPLYKYVPIDGLKRILQGSMRFTQPRAFNDPFELLPEIVTPIDERARTLNISFDITAQRRQPPVGEMEDVPDQCCASDSTSRAIVKQLNSLIGILCLSRVKDSLLMWSHYASQYAGALVEFDGLHEFFDGQIDVEYRSQRPRRNISTYLSPHEPVPVSELCVKSDQWKYESEVRIIRRLSDCEMTGTDPRGFPVYIRKIPRDSIRSVTFGERTTVSDQREIYQCVRDTNISLSLAAIDHWGYEFRTEMIKINGPVSGGMLGITPRTAHIFSHLEGPFGDLARQLIKSHPMSEIVNNIV